MKDRGKSFLEFYGKTNQVPFYMMLALFIISNMLMVVNFILPVFAFVFKIHLIINTVLLILCVMYFAFTLLLWKIDTVNCCIAFGVILIVAFGWNFIGQTNEFFCTIVAALLAILAYQRDFKIILKIVLISHIVTMIVGALGLPLGYTELAYKVQTVDNGFSMGLIYPNHVGRMMFLILIIAWYLWGQERRVITTIVFFAAAYFNWRVVNCRTIVLFLFGFPICWWIISFLYKKHEVKDVDIKGFANIGHAILIAFPFICMLFTYIMGLQRHFFMEHWHFGEGIYALWMRFISAGIYFESFGFPLFGRKISEVMAPMEFSNGQLYVAEILDNAYVYYLIAIGGIALIACMLWLSVGAYRALRNKDLAILLIYFFMCGYGIIETVFFEFEHNFLFFYPLTAAALAYKKKIVAKDEESLATDIEADDINIGYGGDRETEEKNTNVDSRATVDEALS